jgi:nucleotide-binding universal stress UspA family protein
VAVIVVGVDGTSGAAAALAATAQLATGTGTGVVAVHVAHLSAIVAATPESLAVGEAVTANDELGDRCHIDCELALAGKGIAWTFELRHGDPASELSRAGDDHGAACIVVGRHGHRPIARLLLGSVTDRLVHHTNRPVLVVPPAPL